MTIGDRTRAWSLWALRATALTILLLLGIPTAAADPQPGPTSIRVTAEVTSESQVAASGLLTDRDGRAVPDATVQAKLNGVAVGGTTTTPEGTWELVFTLPEDMRSGEQQLVVFFGGSDTLGASQTATTVVTGVAPPPAETSTEPPPPADLPDVNLDVSLAPELVPLGGLVMVEGTLTDDAGTGIPDAKIVLLLDGRESADSLVLTGEQGEFQTFAEVPSNQPEGTAELVVSFAGNRSYDPHSVTFTITVEELDTADPNASTPASGTTSAEPSDTAAATPDPTDAPTDDTQPPPGDRDPLSWFYVALITVGGIAVLVAGALVFRAMYASRELTARDGDSLEGLLEAAAVPEDDAGEPSGDQTSHDGVAAGEDPDGTAEGAPPRRSAD